MCDGGSSPSITAVAAPPQGEVQQNHNLDQDPVGKSSSSFVRGGRTRIGTTTTVVEQSSTSRPTTRSMAVVTRRTQQERRQHNPEILKALRAVQKELVQRSTTTTTTTTRPFNPSAPPLSKVEKEDDDDDDDATNLSFPSPPRQQLPTRHQTRKIGLLSGTTVAGAGIRRTGPNHCLPTDGINHALDSPAHRTRKRIAEAQGLMRSPLPVAPPPRQKPRFVHPSEQHHHAATTTKPNTATTTPTPPRSTFSSRSLGMSILECATAPPPAVLASSGGPMVVVLGKSTPVASQQDRVRVSGRRRRRRCTGEAHASPASSSSTVAVVAAVRGCASNPPAKRKKPSSLYRSSLERLFDGPDSPDRPSKSPTIKPGPSSEPPVRGASRQRTTNARQSKAIVAKVSKASVPRCTSKPTKKRPADTINSKSPDVDVTVALNQHISERGSLVAQKSQELTKCRGVVTAVELVANQESTTEGPGVPPLDTRRGVHVTVTSVDVVQSSLPREGDFTQKQVAPLPRTRERSPDSKNQKQGDSVVMQGEITTTRDLDARREMPAAPVRRAHPAGGPPARMQETPEVDCPTPLRKRRRIHDSKNQKKSDSVTSQDGVRPTSELGVRQEMPAPIHRAPTGGPPARRQPTPDSDCPTSLRKRTRLSGSKNQKKGDPAALQDGVTPTSELGVRQEIPAPVHIGPAVPPPSSPNRRKPRPNVKDRDCKKLHPAAPPHKGPPIKERLRTSTATLPEGLNSLMARAMAMAEQRSPRDDTVPSGSRKVSESEIRSESMRLDGLKNPSELSPIHPAAALDVPSPGRPPVAKLKDPPMTVQLADTTSPLRNRGKPTGSVSRSKRSRLPPVDARPGPHSATANALGRSSGLVRASIDEGTPSVPLRDRGASTDSRRGPGPSSHNPPPRRGPDRPPGARDPRPSGGGPPAVVAAPAVTTRHVYQSCGACSGCRLDIDCGACLPCKQTLNFRGLTLLRPVCVQRVCTNPILQKVLEAAAADDEVQSLDGDADSYLEGDLSDVSSLGR